MFWASILLEKIVAALTYATLSGYQPQRSPQSGENRPYRDTVSERTKSTAKITAIAKAGKLNRIIVIFSSPYPMVSDLWPASACRPTLRSLPKVSGKLVQVENRLGTWIVCSQDFLRQIGHKFKPWKDVEREHDSDGEQPLRDSLVVGLIGFHASTIRTP